MVQEKTLVLIKPEAVKKGYIGQIILRIESRGFRFDNMRLLNATKEQCLLHYNKDDVWCERQGQRKIDQGLTECESALEVGRQILDQMSVYFMSGPLLAMIVEGENCIERIHELVGATEPISAKPGTLRGDLSHDSYHIANQQNRAIYNVAHSSENEHDALREIDIWFPGYWDKNQA